MTSIRSTHRRRPACPDYWRSLRLESLERRVLLDAAGLSPDEGIRPSDFPAPTVLAGQIEGVVWEDSDGNRQRTAGEGTLGGVTVFSDLNANGLLDPHEPHAVTTSDNRATPYDEGGFYRLDVHQAGYHMIRQQTPAGFEQTFPSLPPGHLPPPWGDPSVHVVMVEQGQVVRGIDFGDRAAAPGEVRGLKWEDLNGNSERDPDEPGLAGVTIYSDRNFNNRLDSDEPHAVTLPDDPTTTVDETGQYRLQNLEPGWHWIKEVVPDGFRQTFPHAIFFPPEPGPDGQLPPIPAEAAHDVFVLPGDVIEGLDFGNARVVPSFLRGVKWEDANGDGARQASEPGLPGVTIYSDANFNGVLDPDEARAVTQQDDPATDLDEAGRYELDVPSGFHIIREVVPDGFRQTFPSWPLPFPEPPLAWGILPPLEIGVHYVFLEPGQSLDGIDFGNQRIQFGSIRGVKWEDVHGNAQRDPGEKGLAGVVIYLDQNDNGVLDDYEPRTATSADDPQTDFDEGGRYAFEHLAAGSYIIREVVPNGFAQTFPLANVPLPGPVPPTGAGSSPSDSVDDPFATVTPERLDLVVAPGEITVVEASIAIHPSIFVPIDIDVFASPPEAAVINLSGPQTNGGTNDVSTFEIMILGNDAPYWGQLEFIDLSGGNVIAAIPLTINVQPPRDGSHRVVLESGQTREGLNFGNRPLASAAVAGRKWLDRNGNGQRDLDEPGLAGVTIYADANRNGVLDAGEPRVKTREDNPATDRDETGLYHLDLPAGEHWIAEVVPAGYAQTFPNWPVPAIFPPPPGGNVHQVALAPGELIVDLDFGNRPVDNGAVAGRAWVDYNGNGQRDGNEPGMAGVTIYADQNFNGQLDAGEAHATTAADNPETDFDEGGLYHFPTRPGLQAIRQITPPGYLQTYPISIALSPLEVGAHIVHVPSGVEITDLDFGNLPWPVPGPLPGDLNGDGQVDALDREVWEAGFGKTGASSLDAASVPINGGSFLTWQRHHGPAPVPADAAGLQATLSLPTANLDGSSLHGPRNAHRPAGRAALPAIDAALAQTSVEGWRPARRLPLATGAATLTSGEAPERRDAPRTAQSRWEVGPVDGALEEGNP